MPDARWSQASACVSPARRFREWVRVELQTQETRDWAITLVGYAVRFGLAFAASVVVARWLGPSGYGLVALVTMVAALVHVLGDFGLTYAAIRAVSRSVGSNPEHARRLVYGFLALSMLANTLAAVAGLLLAEPIARLVLARPDAESYLRLALLSVLPLAANGFTSSMLQSTHRFAQLASLQVAGAAAFLLGIVFLAAADELSVATVILVGAASPLVGFAVGLRLLPPGFLSLREALVWPARSVRRELNGFGKWIWVSSGLALLGSQLDLLLVAHWAPAAVVGIYALALSLAIKLDVLNQTRSTVLLPMVSKLGTRADLAAYVRRNVVRGLVLSPVLVLAVPLSDPFILLFYGPDYADSAPLFRALLAVVLFDLVTKPLLLLAFPLNAPRAVAASDLIRVVSLAGFGVWLIPALGPMGAVVARLASRVLGAGFAFAMLWRIAKQRGWAKPAAGQVCDDQAARGKL